VSITVELECVGGPYDGQTRDGTKAFTVTRPIFSLGGGFGQLTMGRYEPKVWPPIGLMRLVWTERLT